LKSLVSFLEHVNIDVHKGQVFNPKRRSSLVTIDQHKIQLTNQKQVLSYYYRPTHNATIQA